MKRPTGTIYNHASKQRFIALSSAPSAIGATPQAITKAIDNGALKMRKISGCKCVDANDLQRLKAEGKL
jgi:hypothetical protein